ncbi:MAG: sulfatase-like hydrolase/transferase, partial [Opitutae bacterium]|nr:sulfatase-like hydrolase/transferase [Opitutae bacterium]
MKISSASLFTFLIIGLLCQAKKQPNVIYILADDLGYGEVGYNGQKMIKTPELDALATGGMRFTDHYCGNAVCAPS